MYFNGLHFLSNMFLVKLFFPWLRLSVTVYESQTRNVNSKQQDGGKVGSEVTNRGVGLWKFRESFDYKNVLIVGTFGKMQTYLSEFQSAPTDYRSLRNVTPHSSKCSNVTVSRLLFDTIEKKNQMFPLILSSGCVSAQARLFIMSSISFAPFPCVSRHFCVDPFL